MMYNEADYANNQHLDMDIFTLFDLDGSGKIDIEDLENIGYAMGWKKQEGKYSLLDCLILITT